MNSKIRNRFVLWATAAILVFLTVILSVINGVNFTMAADDADRLTQRIAEGSGLFSPDGPDAQSGFPAQTAAPANGRFGPMGPDSPEARFSLRYFTVRLSPDGSAELIAYNIAAVGEDDAVRWAQKISGDDTGWTKGTYRYRVYEKNGSRFVTVIDQGRELLPSYRILLISVIGGAAGTLISFFLLLALGKRLFRPLEEADRKQKQFIRDAESEFKIPLTVISANTEMIERSAGQTPQTESINRQVRKMTALVRKISALAIYEDPQDARASVALSDLLTAQIDREGERFRARNIAVSTEIAPGVTINGNAEAMREICRQLTDNSVKFAKSKAKFTLTGDNDRITLCASNDTDLPDGSVDQVFDRFVRLKNAEAAEGDGLGLAFVKDAVKAHNGRTEAKVTGGEFILKIRF